MKDKNVKLKGGKALKKGKTEKDFDKKEVKEGQAHEAEHTDNPKVAKQIALDHLTEDTCYYHNLHKMEKKVKSSKKEKY